jgi:hypothetical protein
MKYLVNVSQTTRRNITEDRQLLEVSENVLLISYIQLHLDGFIISSRCTRGYGRRIFL